MRTSATIVEDFIELALTKGTAQAVRALLPDFN
jgi:hypothetical protein